jgi:GNAT superfamily N-acetyltransferase
LQEVMQVSYLADVPDLAGQLIPGLLDHWRPVVPEDTAEARAHRFRAHMNRDVLPIAWLAHEAGQAAGTAALRASDLPGREELSPWLGGVYVAPQFRGRGIASALCRAVEARAAALGYERLYLFTLDQQALYQHLGWRPFERTSWRGRDADVMSKALASPPPRK